MAALAFCWAVLGAPTGKRLAPIMAELVPTLRRFDELVISDNTEMALHAMSPAAMDRRLPAGRAKLPLRRHSHTKPGFNRRTESVNIKVRLITGIAMACRSPMPHRAGRSTSTDPAALRHRK